jgi:hypothetical protein
MQVCLYLHQCALSGLYSLIFVGGTDYRWFYVPLFAMFIGLIVIGLLFEIPRRRKLRAEFEERIKFRN